MVEHALKENRIVSIASLRPHPRNYRSHPDEQIDDLVASLNRFGATRSIVVQDGPEGYLIVAGHGLVEAAKKLDYTELRADIIPASWTSEQVTGYLVADNQHSQKASDDEALLVALLEEQKNAGHDLASLGTDDETLRQMLEALGDAYLGSSEGERSAPDDFESYDEDIETQYCCPKCQYSWSGKPK